MFNYQKRNARNVFEDKLVETKERCGKKKWTRFVCYALIKHNLGKKMYRPT